MKLLKADEYGDEGSREGELSSYIPGNDFRMVLYC